MPVPQLRDEEDWVETRILCQCVRDELERFAVGLADVGVIAENGTRVLLQLVSHFHFHTCAAWNERSFLNEGTDDTKGVMETSVSLVKDELVRASQQDGDGLALVGALGDLDDFSTAAGADLLYKAGAAELLWLELVDVGDGHGTDSLGDEVHIVTLDVLDHHDFLLGEEMQCQVTDGLPEDALLKKQHVGA